jgi:hypothetical protein
MTAHWTLGCLDRNRVMATMALLVALLESEWCASMGDEVLTHVQTKRATFLPLGGGHLGQKSAQTLAEVVGHLIL